MSDLISRSALIGEIERQKNNVENDGTLSYFITMEIADFFKEIVNREPTVEAKPVVHGEWEDVGDCMGDLCFRCSNCKEEFSCEIDMNSFAKFCPECGADMRGEKHD